MGFRVWLSRAVGAAGLGLLQLIWSVGALALTVGVSGVRITAMYLCAEELGRDRLRGVRRVLDACARYGLVMSVLAGTGLIAGADLLARRWIGDAAAASSLRVLGLFLPAECMCAVFSGWFTASGRIGRLVAVEAIERILSIGLTVLFLRVRAANDPGSACRAIVLGGGVAALVSAGIMGAICLRSLPKPDNRIPILQRMLRICLPLALGDYVRAALSTGEHVLIPRGLRKYGGSVEGSMAAYGAIHGMVFPVILFPTAFLYALIDLLIPELSRSRIRDRHARICALTDRCFRMGAVFACACAGLLHLFSEPLGRLLYRSARAGFYIALFAPVVVILYLDAITDGLLKGLGQQLYSVRCNMFTSALDVAALLVLLPRFGVMGYFISFTATRFLNFLLSIARLCRVTGCRPGVRFCGKLSLCFGLCVMLARPFPAAFLPGFGAAMLLCKVLDRRDLEWLRGIVARKKVAVSGKTALTSPQKPV